MKDAVPFTEEQLSAFRAQYENDKTRRIAANALSKTGLADAAFCGTEAARMHHNFSIEIPTLPVTNQKASGRCWMFAALNVLRERVASKMGLEDFELSQSYLAFWDKFERANYFLETILDTLDLDADDRVLATVLQNGVHDGGQWDMFVNVVKKYGVVPKNVMPETFQSSNTGMMNSLLNTNLKECAVKLRAMHAAGSPMEDLRAAKEEMLGKIFCYLCTCYGEPPARFDFECTDKEKCYHADRDLTPRDFYDKYVGMDLDDYVSVIHAPTKDKPYNRMYTVRYLGNVVEGQRVSYLNLPMEELKALVIRQLQDGEVVWFGSDVGKFGDRAGGSWDDRSFGYEELTGLTFRLTKEERLDYRDSAMNHAMVITGVNLVDGKPNRWKIENSWGDDKGNKGYYIASDSWFDQFVYQAVVQRKYLGEKAALLSEEPIELNPWDPMGSLAD